MTTITRSASSLAADDRCKRAGYYGKILGRRAVRLSPGLIAGKAMHSAFEAINSGKPPPEQDAAIDATLTETPTPIDDYRQATYLKDALAAFRAEFVSLFASWIVEEVEQQGVVELGQTIYRLANGEQAVAHVMWEFRRDLVVVDPDGRRFVVDLKTASRNEDVEARVAHNSGALMGYCRSYEIQHPDRPVHGAQLIRVILRKPSKTGISFEFPRDPSVYFPKERLDEWQRQTLLKCKAILERDPNNPDDWPLASHDKACRSQWGACEYLECCVLPPADRLTMLQTDAFEDADIGRRNNGVDTPQPGDEP